MPTEKKATGTDDSATPVSTVLDSSVKAEHPVDAGVVISATDIAWCANPITTLRPLASDLGVTKRGRCRVT